MVDTSTEAVTKLLDGVTQGPWITVKSDVYPEGECDSWVTIGQQDFDAVALIVNEHIKDDPELKANARFIAAARDLVPALLAERDALRRENENLRQIERNVQAAREHEYMRAEAALAERDAMKVQPITVHDAAKVPEIAALIEAVSALGAMPEGYCFCSENRVGDESKQHEPECRDLRAAIKSFGW